MSNNFVTYVDITPEELTDSQRRRLIIKRAKVLRIYGDLNQQANDEFASGPGSGTGTDEDKKFALAQIFVRILSASRDLASIGGQSRSSDLEVKNPNFHANIIRLAAAGIEGINDSMIQTLDGYIALLTDTFSMGGSQSSRDTRWIITTIYFWDKFLLDFDVQMRLVSFKISAEMEELVKTGKTETGGTTKLSMTFSTNDWVFVSLDTVSQQDSGARSFAAVEEEEESYPHIKRHIFTHGPEIDVLKIKVDKGDK